MRGVVICWKIRIFAYWTTPVEERMKREEKLWFAEKFVSLLIEQHQMVNLTTRFSVVICWKIRIFAYWTTPINSMTAEQKQLWFAEKFVSLLIEQHLGSICSTSSGGCDLLKNSYLCLLNNTVLRTYQRNLLVVICWKIRIFAYWTTPRRLRLPPGHGLWFAEKFVSLLIEQHLERSTFLSA